MLSLSPEQRALLSLTLISGLGPKLMSALIEHFGSAEAVLRARANQLNAVPHIGAKTAQQFRDALDTLDVNGELERMQRDGVRVLFRGSDEYPPALKPFAGSPQLLYIRGELQSRDEQAIAIVGSRHCTPYGKRMAERIAGDLARAGWTVISGLARGIDGASHRGALQVGGRTIAVLAGGLSSIYPPEHKDLAEQVQGAGALLTEAHMRMEPLAVLFPSRNRIISGMARAVVVIEANQKSGALLTARHAAEQGREVFALPGQADSSASAGTLELLRNGVRLVRHADDILEDLQGIVPPASAVDSADSKKMEHQPPAPPPDLDADQQRIWDFLGEQARHQDEIVQQLGYPVSQLSGMLLMLEMKRLIRRLPGNRFERA